MTNFTFSTKAGTLDILRNLVHKSTVLEQYVFNANTWNSNSNKIIDEIFSRFGKQRLAVRSSAAIEDGSESSMAGAFSSILDVDPENKASLINAIESVISSFPYHISNEVFVQPFLANTQMSGVVMTQELSTGAPYYVISYDDHSGKTDTITGGTHVAKTVYIYKGADSNYIISDRISAILNAVKELISIIPNRALDIEFAINTSGILFLLQVRPISVSHRWDPLTETKIGSKLSNIQEFIDSKSIRSPGLYGHKGIYGLMPDWNPAEIIGVNPRPLAQSLYRELVTKGVWAEARALQGYHDVRGTELMTILGGHPYIDIRASANSFLPSDLNPDISEKLVCAWLTNLEANPHYHDKLEFKIINTCFTPNFRNQFQEAYPNILNNAELNIYEASIKRLTNSLVGISSTSNLIHSSQLISTLEDIQKNISATSLNSDPDPLYTSIKLINLCKIYGTLPFACLARHAFIAEAFLRSLRQSELLTEERLHAFRTSIRTITSDLVGDLICARNDSSSFQSFLNKYGHLRPGTYDITSPRYDQQPGLFDSYQVSVGSHTSTEFTLSSSEISDIDPFLKNSGLEFDAHTLIKYSHLAIQAREYAKFIFTRSLSDALVGFSIWGESHGLSTDDISFLSFSTLSDLSIQPPNSSIHLLVNSQIAEARQHHSMSASLRISHLICNSSDIYVVPLCRNEPTYITTQRIQASALTIDSHADASLPLHGRIVCIESADPGYDWIFTKGIVGLVTKYGGSNSHMAIRCAEFNLPAAIGCGDQLFQQITSRSIIDLCCASRIITVS